MVVREVWGGAWPSELLRLFLWRGQGRAVRDGAWPEEVARGRAYSAYRKSNNQSSLLIHWWAGDTQTWVTRVLFKCWGENPGHCVWEASAPAATIVPALQFIHHPLPQSSVLKAQPVLGAMKRRGEDLPLQPGLKAELIYLA